MPLYLPQVMCTSSQMTLLGVPRVPVPVPVPVLGGEGWVRLGSWPWQFGDSSEVPRPWELPCGSSVAVIPPWQFGNYSEVPRPWQLPFGSSSAVAPSWRRVKILGGESNSLAASRAPWRRVELLGVSQVELSPGGVASQAPRRRVELLGISQSELSPGDLGRCEGGRGLGL